MQLELTNLVLCLTSFDKPLGIEFLLNLRKNSKIKHVYQTLAGLAVLRLVNRAVRQLGGQGTTPACHPVSSSARQIQFPRKVAELAQPAAHMVLKIVQQHPTSSPQPPLSSPPPISSATTTFCFTPPLLTTSELSHHHHRFYTITTITTQPPPTGQVCTRFTCNSASFSSRLFCAAWSFSAISSTRSCLDSAQACATVSSRAWSCKAA